MQHSDQRATSEDVTGSKTRQSNERVQRSHDEQEPTVPLSVPVVFKTLILSDDIFAQLETLVINGQYFDGIVIDVTQLGFSIRLDVMVKLGQYAERLLMEQGVLLLIKTDAAIALVKEEPGRGLSYN
ncbi:MAG TPA: hypothetical protein V6D22_11000, partial [Candidatus Obscuribacterales bacterium]